MFSQSLSTNQIKAIWRSRVMPSTTNLDSTWAAFWNKTTNGTPITNFSLTAGTGISLVNSVNDYTISASGVSGVSSVIGTANQITVTGTTTPTLSIASTYPGGSSIATTGTITAGEWQGTTIANTYTQAKVASVTGTANQITVTGTTTPTLTIASTYPGGSSIAATGTITAGEWQGTTIANTYTQAKVASVTGTTNQITVTGTTTPTLTIASTYPGGSSIATTGTITAGDWRGTTVGVPYGGTGVTTFTTGGVLYAPSSNTIGQHYGLTYNGAGYLSVDSAINLRTGATGFKFGVRNAVTSFPVPYFRPTTATKTIAMDLMPNGAPSDFSGNGLCWFDCDDKDTYIDENNLNTARVGISSTVAYVGSMKFGTATAKPFCIVVGTSESTDRVMTFTTNKASVSMDQNIAGYSSFFCNNPNTGTAGAARIYSTSNVGHIGLYSFGSGFTNSNMRKASQAALLVDNSVQGLNIGTEGAFPLMLWTNNVLRTTVSSAGLVTWASAYHLLAAGTATAGQSPLKFQSGTNNTTAEPGAMEYNGTNLFFTRSGTTRESVITANAVNVVSPTAPNRTITVVIDGTTYYLAAKTTND